MVNDDITQNLKITNEKAGTKRNHKGLYKRHINAIKFIEKHIPKNRDISILDAGCREGLFLEKLLERGYKDLYGVDISKKAIKLIDKKEINGCVGDVCNLPYENDKFDFVVCTHTLEHCEQPELALNELYRVVKNNGFVLLEVPIENVETPRKNVGHFSCFKTNKEFVEFVEKKLEILNSEKDPNSNKDWFRIICKVRKDIL